MYLDQSLVASPQQSLNISAKLIESIKILQCSSEELEQSVAQELAEDPAFEVDELEQCLRCGTPLINSGCPTCDSGSSESSGAETLAELADWDDWSESRAQDLSLPDDDETHDPLSFVRSGGTLHDHLVIQLGMLIAWEDQPIAEFLIGSLDSHGYITVSVSEAAEALDVPAERIERVLDALQSLDPIGIGARSLRECLLIQLRAFRERGSPYPLVEVLVADHLDELGEHHFLEIGRQLNVTSTQVKRAWRFIKANLNPFPRARLQRWRGCRRRCQRGAPRCRYHQAGCRRTAHRQRLRSRGDRGAALSLHRPSQLPAAES